MTTHKAVLMLLLTTFIWGTGFIGVQMALDYGYAPLRILTVRFVMAALVFDLVCFKKLRAVNKAEVKLGSLLAFFMFGGFFFQTVGQDKSTPSVCAFVTSSYVMMVPFIDWLLLKKKPGPWLMVCSAVTLAGVALISVNGDFSISAGALLTLASAVFYAFQVSCTGIFTKTHSPAALTAVMLNVMALAAIALTVLEYQLDRFLASGAAARQLPVFPPQAAAVLAYLALFCTLIAFFAQSIGQKYTTGTQAAIIFSTESVFGALLSAIIYKEIFSAKMVLGCVLIFAAIVLSNLNLRRVINGRNLSKKVGQKG
ncbi:MAG: DMT family transporter [Clostridiales bacterium]|jgi:drug/metabolite transporter (DMT)-like permease|nr:DMT family transporter [Clostridiales bacterium]